MTNEYTGRSAHRVGPVSGHSVGQETEVERARAELVAALTELEDKVNIPKRIRRLREEDPNKFLAGVSAVGTVAAGIIALSVTLLVRRRH
ncbi:hypothetical protein GCM10022286_22710 [Gryllotalpicola daejeonensis]|uniref:DUF3618 domain-containing protein n=1 Tax=Gryllotalpicola daejeonensis TaxID=993087 RepID=A0ABP7ZM10_9MICO